MNKFKVYSNIAVRFAAPALILLFCTALFSSNAMSCPNTKGRTAVSQNENSANLSEEFLFLIQDFKMNHQTQANNLNIKIRYCYKTAISNSDYPDFRTVLTDIQEFLTNYPNKVDYWEIVNKNITLMVLKKYPMLESITSKIEISPSSQVPFMRSSIVTRHQSKDAKMSNKKALTKH